MHIRPRTTFKHNITDGQTMVNITQNSGMKPYGGCFGMSVEESRQRSHLYSVVINIANGADSLTKEQWSNLLEVQGLSKYAQELNSDTISIDNAVQALYEYGVRQQSEQVSETLKTLQEKGEKPEFGIDAPLAEE